jgi:RNA polymerase sigma-70 factor (ECF subfamily)
MLKNLHRWDQERDFEPWLLAIAGNRCRTALATRKRRPRWESEVELLADDEPAPWPAQQLAEEVRLALGKLRSEYRQAFILFHEHEMSYAQIADAMDIPLGTVKTWVHRARRDLIDHLRQRGVIAEARHALPSVRQFSPSLSPQP